MLNQVFDAGKQGWKDGWAEAENFEQSLDEESADADTSESMDGASEETDFDTGEDEDIIQDAAQEDVADI
jgi:hypothetical protein